jgi:hypothetical protein
MKRDFQTIFMIGCLFFSQIICKFKVDFCFKPTKTINSGTILRFIISNFSKKSVSESKTNILECIKIGLQIFEEQI